MPLPVFLAAALLALPPGVDPTLLPGADTRDPAEIRTGRARGALPRQRAAPAAAGFAGGEFGTVAQVRRVAAQRSIYVRVYDLKFSKSQLAEALASNPLLIVDFRYVVADAPDAEDFADALAKAGLASVPVHGRGHDSHEPADLPAPVNPDKPAPLVLVLVNGQTAGPLEAWLAAFQEKESVLAVGTPTAGQPGAYQPAPGHPDYYIISGELQPESGSVAGTGLQPRFEVEVTPEQNKLAYDRVESGPLMSRRCCGATTSPPRPPRSPPLPPPARPRRRRPAASTPRHQ